MRHLGLLLVGAVLGAAVTVVASSWLAPAAGRGVEPPTGIAGTVVAADRPADGQVAALERRLVDLQAAVAEIDRRLDLALTQRRSITDPPAASTGATIDADLLQHALERAQANAERQKFLAQKPGEVLQTAEALVNSRQDLGTARQMLEDLLSRPLDPVDRQRALLQLGIAHRTGGDFAAAKVALQQGIDLAGGSDTEAGAWAAFQMAWTCQFEQDPAAARRWFEQVAASSGSPLGLRLEGRWNAAKLAADAGDPRSRAEFEAILRDCGDAPGYAHILADVRARLGR